MSIFPRLEAWAGSIPQYLFSLVTSGPEERTKLTAFWLPGAYRSSGYFDRYFIGCCAKFVRNFFVYPSVYSKLSAPDLLWSKVVGCYVGLGLGIQYRKRHHCQT